MREKQWKVCAKELITRCICVLFWRGERDMAGLGHKAMKEEEWMDMRMDGWVI